MNRTRLNNWTTLLRVLKSEALLTEVLIDRRAVDYSPETVFYPVRHFNTEALELPDGRSVFEGLCALGETVVIEDVDLTASLLCSHLQRHRLHHLAASDATGRSRMRTANLLCVSERDLASVLPGKRIW